MSTSGEPMDNRERAALKLARTRIEILLARMRFCNTEPQRHDLSLDEGSAWLAEMDEQIRNLGEARAAIEGEQREEVRSRAELLVEDWDVNNAIALLPDHRNDLIERITDVLRGTKLPNAQYFKCGNCGNGPIVERDIRCEICAPWRAERVLEAGGDKGAGYCREVREAVHGSDKPSASVPVAAAAPLPTAREPQVFGWNIEQILVYIWQCMSEGDDEEANPWPFSTFSVSPMAARLRSEIAALAAPQPVSEGRLREALEEAMTYLDCHSHVVCPKCKEEFKVFANGVTEPTLKKLRERVAALESA